MILDDFEAEAQLVGRKNEKGFYRVKEINVRLIPKSSNAEVKRRMKTCLKIFEKACTVTQSVRAGIPVNVNIDF